jgi:mRNA-degrading endonuclease RelE of RelBE toxin-antitoxin system
MAFKISITADAEDQLRALPARDQRVLEAAILSRLRDRPTQLTRAIKALRPNAIAGFELRVGDLRVLYNVVDDEVILLVVGRKVGNSLVVKGQAFHGHQDNPPQPPGEGRPRDAE